MCTARRQRKVQPRRVCIECGRLQLIQSHGRCAGCYNRARPRSIIVCLACRGSGPHQAFGLCVRCYAKQYRPKQRRCSECDHVDALSRGLCGRCYDRSRAHPPVRCDRCGDVRIDAGGGRCARCWVAHGRPVRVCKRCARPRIGLRSRNGLCDSCRAHGKQRRRIVCLACGRDGAHAARGLCARCYHRTRDSRKACGSCGTVDHLQRGLCHRCFFASDQVLDRVCRAVRTVAQPWREKLVRQFHRYLRGRGYSNWRAAYLASRFAVVVRDSSADGPKRFCLEVATSIHAELISRGVMRGLDARLREFLVDARLAREVNLSTSPHVGRTRVVLDTIPDVFRADVLRHHETLLDEERYRRSVGERARSDRSHYHIVRRFAEWAHWMHGRGLVSWQQLTPDVVRQRLAELAFAGRPRALRTKLVELRDFLEDLVTQRRVFTNPLRSLRGEPQRSMTARGVHAARIKAWLDALTTATTDAAARVVGLLVLLHGLSVIEIRSLHARDYDGRHGTLRVRRRRLTIELDPITRDAVRSYLATRHVTRNPHLLVTTKTRTSRRAANAGFVQLRLRSLGMRSRDVRHHLIQLLATEHGTVIAAQYFRMSVEQISRHLHHQSVLFRQQNQVHTETIQDYV